MTRFEQIAAAFPLHAQRIAELTGPRKEWLYGTPDTFDLKYGASAVLRSAFTWSIADEGFEYWCALSDGVKLTNGART